MQELWELIPSRLLTDEVLNDLFQLAEQNQSKSTEACRIILAYINKGSDCAQALAESNKNAKESMVEKTIEHQPEWTRNGLSWFKNPDSTKSIKISYAPR